MNWDLVLKYSQLILSWPAVALVVFFYLRKPIFELIRRITSLKFPGGELGTDSGYKSELSSELKTIKEKYENATSNNSEKNLNDFIFNELLSTTQAIHIYVNSIWQRLHVLEPNRKIPDNILDRIREISDVPDDLIQDLRFILDTFEKDPNDRLKVQEAYFKSKAILNYLQIRLPDAKLM